MGLTNGIRFRQGQRLFLFATAVSGLALVPTLPPIQWVPGFLSPGVKRLLREADHLPPPIAEVNEWSYNCTLPYGCMECNWVEHRILFHDMVPGLAQEQIYLYFYTWNSVIKQLISKSYDFVTSMSLAIFSDSVS
jgi:hypothetical protein